MVGKVWSDYEEKYFWRTAISNSSKRVGIDLAKPERSWDQLAMDMQRAMGDNARREYTGTMLFEHYFQNVESQRRSPYAAVYVAEYLRRLNPNREPNDILRRAQYFRGNSSGSPSRRRPGRPSSTSIAAAAATRNNNAPNTRLDASGNPIAISPNSPVVLPLPDFNAPMPAATRGPANLEFAGVPWSPGSTRPIARDENEESLFVPQDDELEEGEIRQ
ncbi:hypothetical protein F4810DRAFT_666004 [Camillea tinctor]|nr:hypothetical protein F4810DRAFT_666004 [Camillea tinctor]